MAEIILEQTMKAQMGSRGIAVLFLYLGSLRTEA